MSTQPKLVPIKQWARSIFGENAPHQNTLQRWANNGNISPRATKVGKNWFVKPDAEYKVR
jgi:predicted site-specific integrase-resolvase